MDIAQNQASGERKAKPSFGPEGPVIGTYKGHPIHEGYRESDVRFTYDRILVVEKNGEVDIRQLKDGELAVPPGLVYRPS